jgi:hypothetical protein
MVHLNNFVAGGMWLEDIPCCLHNVFYLDKRFLYSICYEYPSIGWKSHMLGFPLELQRRFEIQIDDFFLAFLAAWGDIVFQVSLPA